MAEAAGNFESKSQIKNIYKNRETNKNNFKHLVQVFSKWNILKMVKWKIIYLVFQPLFKYFTFPIGDNRILG